MFLAIRVATMKPGQAGAACESTKAPGSRSCCRSPSPHRYRYHSASSTDWTTLGIWRRMCLFGASCSGRRSSGSSGHQHLPDLMVEADNDGHRGYVEGLGTGRFAFVEFVPTAPERRSQTQTSNGNLAQYGSSSDMCSIGPQSKGRSCSVHRTRCASSRTLSR